MKDLAKLKALHQEIATAREAGLLDALLAQRIYAEAIMASENDPRFLESFLYQLNIPQKAWLLGIEGWFEETPEKVTFRVLAATPTDVFKHEATLATHVDNQPLDLKFEDGRTIQVMIIDALSTKEPWRVVLRKYNPKQKIGYGVHEVGKPIPAL